MPRSGLSRPVVVREAAEVADEVGLDRLTLAAVAARLGVRLPSLYKHVDGLDGLRRDLSLLGLTELGRALERAAVGRSGADALSGLATAYRDFARSRPGLYAATVRAVDPADEELAAASGDVLRVVAAVLSGYALEGDDFVDATRALRAALHGFVALETGGGFGMDRSPDDSFRRLVHGLDTSFRATAPTA